MKLTFTPLRRLAQLGAATSLAFLAGCASTTPPHDAGEPAQLDLRRYFDGRLIAHGMFSDRSGRVVRRFVVELDARWQGEEGVLDERFRYSDGSTERRVWRLRHLGEGRYEGRADDVVGVARGVTAGPTLRWRYTLALPVDGRVWEVAFDDRMVLVDDGVLLNRAEMSKFGIRLGEVTLAFQRVGAAAVAAAAQP